MSPFLFEPLDGLNDKDQVEREVAGRDLSAYVVCICEDEERRHGLHTVWVSSPLGLTLSLWG